MIVTRLKDIILQKAKNPNWNWKNPKQNFFQNPEIPYIFINLFDLGEEMAGATL